MIRNLQISKETQDKVKLAKKYIEDKYQFLVEEQLRYHQNWSNLLSSMNKNKLDISQKQILTTKIIEQHTNLKRLQRKKDYLTNYKLYNLIGRGAFGEVRLARNLFTNEVVAIKRLQKKKLQQKRQIYNAYLQRDLMAKNRSKFLVQLKSTFQDENYLYLVMEFVAGGDLLHLLIEKDILTEQQTRFYIAQMILAVEEIHKMNYIHRDIKPDNVLLDAQGHIKISDFGLSKYLQPAKDFTKSPLTKISQLKKHLALRGRNKCFSKVGTPDYISPQVLTEDSYDSSVDIWGIGVVMFECLFGYPPFSHDDSKQVCNRVVNWLQYLQFPDQLKVSIEAKMLILGMMNTREQRMTIKQIKAHPFFKGVDWENIRDSKAPITPVVKSELDTNNFDQFQEQDPWITNQRQTFKKGIHRPRSSSIDIPRFTYAGFDYTKIDNNQNIFQTVQKQMMMITRDKSLDKSFQKPYRNKKTSQKRIKTQFSTEAVERQRNTLRQAKMRGSIGKQNKQKIDIYLMKKSSLNKMRVYKSKNNGKNLRHS